MVKTFESAQFDLCFVFAVALQFVGKETDFAGKFDDRFWHLSLSDFDITQEFTISFAFTRYSGNALTWEPFPRC